MKGPSAILYGITDSGGLINMITKKPQFIRYGSVSMQAGEYSTLLAEVDLTGPIGDGENPPMVYRLDSQKDTDTLLLRKLFAVSVVGS